MCNLINIHTYIHTYLVRTYIIKHGGGSKDRLAIAIRSLKDRCVTIVSLTQVLV